MKIGVIRGQKQSNKRNSAGVSTLLCANWLKNCVCKVIFLLSSYSVCMTMDLDHMTVKYAVSPLEVTSRKDSASQLFFFLKIKYNLML